jgi:hypothetical protein
MDPVHVMSRFFKIILVLSFHFRYKHIIILSSLQKLLLSRVTFEAHTICHLLSVFCYHFLVAVDGKGSAKLDTAGKQTGI